MCRSAPSLTATVRILTTVVDACYPRNLHERKFMDSWDTLEQHALELSDISLDRCKFGKYLDSLGEYASYVHSALGNTKISNKALHRAMQSRGMDCGITTLDKHRAKVCTCYKDNR